MQIKRPFLLVSAFVFGCAVFGADDYSMIRSLPQVKELEHQRAKLAGDKYRPKYHFSVPANNMNDPNGLTWWGGKYHLFYQFVPPRGDTVLLPRGLGWGHAVSEDLVHWQDMPIAFHPEKDKGDGDACYSGQNMVDGDKVIAFYHGKNSGNCIALARDKWLMHWEKNPANPVVPNPKPGEKLPYPVFDPCIWKVGDTYYSLSGGRRNIPGLGWTRIDTDYLFKSTDLTNWEPVHDFYEGGYFTNMDEDAAVPNFLPLGDKNNRWMLMFFSHPRGAQYYVGRYHKDQEKFLPMYHGRINNGPMTLPGERIGTFNAGSLHAPSATIDGKGRIIGMFNMLEGVDKEQIKAQGWNQTMALPRVFEWEDDGNEFAPGRRPQDGVMRITPTEELAALRTASASYKNIKLPANKDVFIVPHGKSLEIVAEIDLKDSKQVGMKVFATKDGQEETLVTFVQTMNGLMIDTTKGSIWEQAYPRTPEIGFLRLPKGEPLKLRVFIDQSIIEVFANDVACLTTRVYPHRDDADGIAFFSRAADAEVKNVTVYQMKDIWAHCKQLKPVNNPQPPAPAPYVPAGTSAPRSANYKFAPAEKGSLADK